MHQWDWEVEEIWWFDGMYMKIEKFSRLNNAVLGSRGHLGEMRWFWR
jgi:hypothetical protein